MKIENKTMATRMTNVNKNNKEAFDAASRVRFFSKDDNLSNDSTYLNLSYNYLAGDDAAVASMVRRQSDELDLLSRRTLGSIPSRSAPHFLIKTAEEIVKKISGLIQRNGVLVMIKQEVKNGE